LKVAAEVGAALTGAPLAVYTATLVSDTAIPVWHEARRELPFLFAAGAAASAGAAATLVTPLRHAGPARRLAIGAAIAGEGVAALMERRLGFVGEPYRQGATGRLGRLSTAAAVSGAALLGAHGRRNRAAATFGSLLVLGGEAGRRFTVFKAGLDSARDPAYTVRLQKERLGRGDPPAQPGGAVTRSPPL
jgi:hypothetical protein